MISSIILLSLLSLCAGSVQLQLVGIDGVFKSLNQLTKSIGDQKILSNKVAPISIIESNLGNGLEIINRIFKLNLKPSSKGAYLFIGKDSSEAMVFTSYDAMFSAKFCGSKAADLCSAYSNCIIFALDSNEISDQLNGYNQIFRRIFYNMNKSVSEKTCLTFLVDVAGIGISQQQRIENEVGDYLREIFHDFPENVNFEDACEINAIFFDSGSNDSVDAARESLEQFFQDDGKHTLVDVNKLSTSLFESWSKVPSGLPKPVYSSMQRKSLYAIELAYSNAIAQIEATIAPWQTRVGAGKVVGKFGDRTRQLTTNIMTSFSSKTVGSLTVRERARRASQLRDSIKSAAQALFANQLVILQSKAANDLKKILTNLASTGVSNPGGEEEQQALRNVVFAYRVAVSELVNEDLELDVPAADYNELEASLQNIASEFPETTAARLASAQKVEKQVRSPKSKRKGSRGFNIGLNLVGMFRPPGYGSLQGFIGYSTGIFGLPLDILMGVQNDGDSPEIMGEDREHPLLRLQPKIHFDVDL